MREIIMELRHFSSDLTPAGRCDARRSTIERELGVELSALAVDPAKLGHAEERNCEQMFGHVPIPVGCAGPLRVRFGGQSIADVWLPLATTEGALVASVNRGCKALREGADTRSEEIGVTRSIAFRLNDRRSAIGDRLSKHSREWMRVGEATSSHLHILGYDIDASGDFLFLTLRAATGDAMGMNMVTIAAQAVGDWISANIDGLELVTIAANVDSDKKPSERTRDRGRGIRARAEATVAAAVIADVLKTTPEAMLRVAEAKLEHGSALAGSLGRNLHAANVVAAIYLATGQDAAHVVESSLASTTVGTEDGGLRIAVELPALLVGVRGGGTTLPAQRQCLSLLLRGDSSPEPRRRLAESIAAAVLAGELSLLAAQASQGLAKAHKKLSR